MEGKKAVYNLIASRFLLTFLLKIQTQNIKIFATNVKYCSVIPTSLMNAFVTDDDELKFKAFSPRTAERLNFP